MKLRAPQQVGFARAVGLQWNRENTAEDTASQEKSHQMLWHNITIFCVLYFITLIYHWHNMTINVTIFWIYIVFFSNCWHILHLCTVVVDHWMILHVYQMYIEIYLTHTHTLRNTPKGDDEVRWNENSCFLMLGFWLCPVAILRLLQVHTVDQTVHPTPRHSFIALGLPRSAQCPCSLVY